MSLISLAVSTAAPQAQHLLNAIAQDPTRSGQSVNTSAQVGREVSSSVIGGMIVIRDAHQTSNFKSSAVRKQMFIAEQILDKVRGLDDTATIAGGAARDWYMNKLATDIDIFYHFHASDTHEKDLQAHLKILKLIFPDVKLQILGLSNDLSNAAKVEDQHSYLKNPNIRHVFEFTYRGQVFQLISKVSKASPVPTFPYNMCQAWSDGVEICCTELFKVGFKKGLLIETGDLYCGSGKYQKKMLEKFPDYTYIKTRIVYADTPCSKSGCNNCLCSLI